LQTDLLANKREALIMCEFLSWIETVIDGETHYFYLTQRELRDKRGRELAKRRGDNINGHGAIREYYDLDNVGRNRECTDFSTPDNFPLSIVADIKAGAFCGFGISTELLTPAADAEYEKVQQPADAEYREVVQPAYAEYRKIEQAAWAEYREVVQPAFAEYRKVVQPALAEYREVVQPAFAEYEKVRQAALAEYEKVRRAAFWNLFADPENRPEVWR
jgi:DNA-binding cell septation regulator SpoVG